MRLRLGGVSPTVSTPQPTPLVKPLPIANFNFMQFKSIEAEQEWEQTVAEAPKHDRMVSQAVAFFVNWVAAMEICLEADSYEADEAFNSMAEACMIKTETDLNFKQLTWVLTWVKRVWLHGERIQNGRFF